MIVRVATLEGVDRGAIEGKYTPEQVGLLYYFDRKQRIALANDAAQLTGAHVGERVAAVLAEILGVQ